MSNDSAALAGWATNPRAPIDQRLAAAAQALDYYVNQQDQLHALLEDLTKSYPNPAPNTTESIVIERLSLILDVDTDDEPDTAPETVPPLGLA